MLERNHHQKSQRDDTLSDQHAGRLPSAEVGNLREGVRPHADDIGKTCKDREDEARADQTAADVTDDGAFESPPQGVQAEVTAEADPCQTDQKDDDLHKSDHGAAVPAEEIGLGAHGEDEESDKGDDETQSNPRGERIIRWERASGNGGRCRGRLVGHKIIFSLGGRVGRGDSRDRIETTS